MTPNRTTIRLATGVLVLLAAVPTFAQDLQGVQFGAPPEISPYERGPQPHEGYFFSIDELYWSISRPQPVPIGSPSTRRVAELVSEIAHDANSPPGLYAQIEQRDFFSAENTCRLTSKFVGGERIEFGRVEDGHGWMVSLFKLRDQNQGFELGTTDVNFDDPSFIHAVSRVTGEESTHHFLFGQVGVADVVTSAGTIIANVAVSDNLPVTFTNLQVRNQTQFWNVELSYLHRLKPLHYGGHFEWFLGARYLEFDDTFDVAGQGGVLDQSEWHNQVQNHIVGPQLGGRCFRQFTRLIFSSEARLTAGYNRQTYRLHGFLGTNMADPTNNNFALDGQALPVGWAGSEFNNCNTADEFSGVGELRFDLRYVLTRNIDVRVGWTGMWLGSIARASTAILYQVPSMQVDTSNNHENVFVHGIYVGVDVNR